MLERDVRRALRGRRLVWFGTRGDDVESLATLPELQAVFTVVNRYSRRSHVEAWAFEDSLGRRVDLDAHDIDDELGTSPMTDFRQPLLRALSRPSVVITYRPSVVLAAACFARSETADYRGMAKDHQSAFEHKPWVETEVRRLGVPTIPWRYVADEDQLSSLTLVHDGPVVLRRSRSSGGTGVARVDDPHELAQMWPRETEAFVSVAPYLENGLPVNVGAVVWNDGITVHPGSVQLIGVPELTTRPFGFCGNDFALFSDLDREIIDQVDASTRRIGLWLQSMGYRGAFGVDYLVVEGVPLFTEVNPRFQGSTHASAQLSIESGRACILLEHLASVLGLDAPAPTPLVTVARESVALSHVVLHADGSGRDAPASAVMERALMTRNVCRVDVLAPDHLPLDPGATVARATVRDSVSNTGLDLRSEWREAVVAWSSHVKGNNKGVMHGVSAVGED